MIWALTSALSHFGGDADAQCSLELSYINGKGVP
jgi:hypothetical protein